MKDKDIKIILNSMIGTIIAILLCGSIYYFYDYNFNFETIEKVERLDVKANTIIQYPYNSIILCEKGVFISSFKNLNNKTIYGCLNVINNKCSGEGKICMIKTFERVRK